MPLAVEELLGPIEKFQFMPARDFAAMKERWFRKGRKEVDDASRFCEWLRVNRFLTDFVLSALTRGSIDRLILDKYRLTERIRAGAQAGDFLAADPMDRTLRLQILSPAVAQDPARLESFRQGVQRFMKVHHPNVARLLEFGHARGVYYVISEYVEGETLEDALKRRGKLSYELAARVFAVVYDALNAVHQAGVPAGEIGPEWLVFTGGDKATGGGRTIRWVNAGFPQRLFDSSALEVGDKAPSARRHSGAAEASGGMLRPEEDVHRFGLLFRRCVLGPEPEAAGDGAKPARALPSIRQKAPDAPEMLADLIDRLTAVPPGSRLPSAVGVAKGLRVYLRTEEESRKAVAEDKIEVPVPSPPADAGEAEGDGSLAIADTASAAAALAARPLELPDEEPGEPPINRFFRAVMQHDGSDLHMAVGLAPMVRVRSVIRPMDHPALGDEEMHRLAMSILTERTQRLLDETGGADFAHVIGNGVARFRVNLFKQRGQLSLVARLVNTKVPTFEKLRLPGTIEKLCHFDQGMVIVAGVTGSGKSTTLAAMIDYINAREQVHILTVEDPIEYLFKPRLAIINQREVGIDVLDWHVALKHAVRQDPDVILVGEMRDRETFEAGLNAAETGHLVFCTIHASTAPSTIGRILDLFPADMHQAMRQSLAFNLKAIICQKLLPSIQPGVQRVPSNEIMIMNPTIRDLIVKGEDKKLPDAIGIGLLEGMMDFNESLRQLVARGDVSDATALEASPNPDALQMALKGIRVARPGIL